ncbi:universal stress protein [Alkalinema sp. FACHB-956]|uniref:universal stress protein n=1 Tax=Alkalinema sp. FACHB-956 TaxID=2692768 RepID=UPI001686F5CB|nr:universal stress protein [Alkalinema sp. FACHB-956]MBD2329030.1 universal stress protein [Alkalinema sp. FACHB-956]
MLKTVLVALDPADLNTSVRTSMTSQVVEALQILHLDANSKIVLSHVVATEHLGMDVLSDRPPVETQTMSDLWAVQLSAYQEQLPCPSTLEIVTGDPAEEIVRLAKIHQADLIVIGSRGLTGMQRILQRSVSSQVFDEAPCSVLVVKPSPDR